MTEEVNPAERILVRYPLFTSAIARVEDCFNSFGNSAEPLCCPIVGESGGGKTTIISHFANLHPPIDHSDGMELPVLLAKIPSRPTVKSLLEVLKQNEQLRRRFGATVRVGAFRWDQSEERTAYRAFLRAVQEQLSGYDMPTLSEVGMAFRMHYASYGLVGYTMKIIRGAARIAIRHRTRKISLDILSESFAEHVWSERLGKPNPFTESFNPSTAPAVKAPQAMPPQIMTQRQKRLIELHA